MVEIVPFRDDDDNDDDDDDDDGDDDGDDNDAHQVVESVSPCDVIYKQSPCCTSV